MEEVKTQEQEVQDTAQQPVKDEKGKNILMAVLCYLGIFILVPLVTEAKKDPFVKFHIKQGLVLIIAIIINWVILVIPIIGWIVGFIFWIIIIILWLIGLINALGGKEKELPIIGKYGARFNI